MLRTPEIHSAHTPPRDRTSETWDLVGIGVGPFHLARAVMIEEEDISVHGREPMQLFVDPRSFLPSRAELDDDST